MSEEKEDAKKTS